MRDDLSPALLSWYDLHARVLPWRVGPEDRKRGRRPDPYGVWLSEIMLQQTTVAAVRSYWTTFMARWPHVKALADADDDAVMAAWAGLGYYARARNLLKCARVIAAEHDGQFPQTEEALRKLPGIGPYTAAAIAAIVFDRQATVVDGNVERVISRLYEIDIPLPKSKAKITEIAEQLTPSERPGDYAQAMMDLGATLCTPRTPACGLCPVSKTCRARASGRQVDYPVKATKKEKPVRKGHTYIAYGMKGYLLERRANKGLLGGMLGFPGSEWSASPAPSPPFVAHWQEIGTVRHTFTHFHLILTIHIAPALQCIALQPVVRDDLPSAFRKAFDLAKSHIEVGSQ